VAPVAVVVVMMVIYVDKTIVKVLGSHSRFHCLPKTEVFRVRKGREGST
jgi:hypothetical protein